MNDEPKAFPSHCSYDEGMNLRDWLAGCALTGLCASRDNLPLTDAESLMVDAYKIADAGMCLRSKPMEEPNTVWVAEREAI